MEKTKVNAAAKTGLTPRQRISHITKWLKNYAKQAKISTFVVGISGGIDSSVVSALCAKTGIKTVVVQMPIRQDKKLDKRSALQATWLLERHDNVTHMAVDLTSVFNAFEKKVDPFSNIEDDTYDTYKLASANSRARLRMMTLYQIAQCHNGLVVGTGNKVEDFGVGFFTKYGDGGVDLSPIGDCLKTEVWAMAREMGIEQEIIDAPPTDGLWDDGRTDESQLGMTYPELEHAMELHNHDNCVYEPLALNKTEKAQLKKYREIRARNMHKMRPIPVCEMPK